MIEYIDMGFMQTLIKRFIIYKIKHLESYAGVKFSVLDTYFSIREITCPIIRDRKTVIFQYPLNNFCML